MNAGRLFAAFCMGSSEPVSSFTFDSIQPGTLNQVSLLLKVDDGYDVSVDWGDGNTVSITADGHDQTVTSTYASTNTTYHITISGNLGRLRKFFIGDEATVSNLDIDDLATTGLTQLSLGQLGSGVSGSIENLPDTLYNLTINSTGTTISGAPVNSPSGITNFWLQGLNSLSGAIPTNTSHPDTFRLYLQSCSGLNGTISTCPAKLRYFRIQSITGIGGSFDSLCSGCPELVQIYFLVVGTTMTGTSALTLPSGLLDVTIQGSSGASWSLNLSDFAQCTNIYLNTLGNSNTGAIESLTGAVTAINIVNCGTTINYGGGTVPAWATTSITFQAGMTTANLDAFLNAWATTAGSGTKTINLAGNNQARSSASNAAVTTLNGLGKTIVTN